MKKLLVILTMLVANVAIAKNVSFVVCTKSNSKSHAIQLLNLKLFNSDMTKTAVSSSIKLSQEENMILTGSIRSISAVTFYTENSQEHACVTVQGENYRR